MWLVSVRNVAEMRKAIPFGVDIVDFKEPHQGPLAPVDPDIWRAAVDEIEERPRLSAALGERQEMLQVAEYVPPSFAYAKVGPSGCQTSLNLIDLWAQTRQRLDDRVELVAVAYADFEVANCAPPEVVFDVACEFGIQRCLIDTYTKNGESIFDSMGQDRLGSLSQKASSLGLWWALAGSIDAGSLSQFESNSIEPDCVGIRGAACSGNRTATICSDRLAEFADAIQQHNATRSESATRSAARTG